MKGGVRDEIADEYRLAFVFTTVVAALHVKRTSRGDTAPPPQMQGV